MPHLHSEEMQPGKPCVTASTPFKGLTVWQHISLDCRQWQGWMRHALTLPKLQRLGYLIGSVRDIENELVGKAAHSPSCS